MLNVLFDSALAAGLFALLYWGARNLPAERWQMIAAIPLRKAPDGSWQGLNFTYYGFFSATGTVFGLLMTFLLLASIGTPGWVSVAIALFLLCVCVPASRAIAWLVERKRGTFTVAGASLVASLVLPWLVLELPHLDGGARSSLNAPLAIFAALAIGYNFGESLGRLACLSFGCCYGSPLRDTSPWLARLFQRHNVVIRGATKKASYASGLAGEPLVPVQVLTSAILAVSGVVSTALFLGGKFRAAALIPVVAGWGWRFVSEWLRADYRGRSRVSAYQWMAV